ncbi:hypothetical protein CLAFUW4_03778 [Fulvia fulva]|uniref:2EXR domain-containing protein n=1 Tax=Passalora fulva TaxID=5499 RepID=A0A9Q8P5S9_PASFU|nr:uncharacterized protein CLAFUR5_03750 [Fulvia fulva]KAK4631971.1 hypothetical protein CLAFUR4_03766 [Fulvia fulva]UJO14264.1 hypothetical protein CLAFUR5_03750 [Fulvia fulva]WPV10698.1 hypothetical protein CLAFUW4_03778 [Fulvia fulva]WPV26010.1 hypothetical protein CLAFUW7_03770 [Fulvia fulva]
MASRKFYRVPEPEPPPSTPPQTAPTSTRCYLEDLPPELRLMIWEYCTADFKLPEAKRKKKHLRSHKNRFDLIHSQPALLLTCDSIRVEVLEFYLKWLQGACRQLQSGMDFLPSDWRDRRDLAVRQRVRVERIGREVKAVEMEIVERGL